MQMLSMLLLIGLALSSVARADAPLALNYQGLALDAAGAKLNVPADLAVRIWSDASSTDPGALFSFSTTANVALVTPVVTVPGNAVFADITHNGGRLVVQIRLHEAAGFPGPFMFVVWD